jgi:3(or 17)beta-hydroxysteroid dehydrogenase
MNRVKGKVAIITGGAGGLGKAHALLLAKEGARVVVTDTDDAQGKKVADEINKQGGEAIFIKHDVSKEIEWNRVISETLERFGKLDILVNNLRVARIRVHFVKFLREY